MAERILDLCPMNGPRYDAWERAKRDIPKLVSQGAVDLSRYGIEISGNNKKVVVEGNHRVARIFQLCGNLIISDYLENHYYDNIVLSVINDARKYRMSSFKTFVAICERGLYNWENLE